MLAPVGGFVSGVVLIFAIIFDRSSGEMPRFTVSTIGLIMGFKSEVSSGGCSIKDSILFAKASAISAEVIPKERSLGTSKGSLKILGELHRNVLFSRTSLAVEADMYLKNLDRS